MGNNTVAKRTVESGRIGQAGKIYYYAKGLGAPGVFQQMTALKGPHLIVVSGDGLSSSDLATHFNQLLDLLKANPWTNGCLSEVNWDDSKITFTNGIEVQYQ